MLSKEQIAHGKAIARRRAVNGQPNGYRPYTEMELQIRKALQEDALEENAARHLASGRAA